MADDGRFTLWLMFAVRAAAHRSTPRIVLVLLSVAHAILAVGMFGLPWLPWPAAWFMLFAAAAVSCGWASVRFTSELALAWAGAITISANVLRGGVLIVGALWQLDAFMQFTGWQIVVGVTVWWTMALLLSVLFFRRLEPLASASRVSG